MFISTDRSTVTFEDSTPPVEPHSHAPAGQRFSAKLEVPPGQCDTGRGFRLLESDNVEGCRVKLFLDVGMSASISLDIESPKMNLD